MKYNKSVFLTALFTVYVGFGIADLKAQETVAAAGGSARGGTGSAEYTVGQPVYSYIAGSEGSINEGVQQPWEIQVITGLEDTKDFLLSIAAYPNPTSDLLILKTEKKDIDDLHFQLYNTNGQLLVDQAITGSTTLVHLLHYTSAVYILKISANQDVLKTFQIIKN